MGDGRTTEASVNTAKPAIRDPVEHPGFQSINRGYNAVFREGRLSLGLVVPLETHTESAVPAMTRHLERIQLAEALGFGAIWLRDVPFNVPSFGDAGQLYDPFVYLGFLAARTERIALGVGSVVLPLRHPAHVAKAAASVDELSGGRLILGVASVDLQALTGQLRLADEFAAYAQSKLALTSWSRSLALSLADQGTVMIAVNPG